MQNMLSEQLQEFLGLLKQLLTNLLGNDSMEWVTELKKFLRKEPNWAEGMIYIPIDWSDDLGDVKLDLLQDHINLYNKGHYPRDGWRLPTIGELTRKMKRDGGLFVTDRYYWTGTDYKVEGVPVGKEILKTYNNRGGLSGARSQDMRTINLRLCRPITFPE